MFLVLLLYCSARTVMCVAASLWIGGFLVMCACSSGLHWWSVWWMRPLLHVCFCIMMFSFWVWKAWVLVRLLFLCWGRFFRNCLGVVALLYVDRLSWLTGLCSSCHCSTRRRAVHHVQCAGDSSCCHGVWGRGRDTCRPLCALRTRVAG